jgi:hypothetical protein
MAIARKIMAGRARAARNRRERFAGAADREAGTVDFLDRSVGGFAEPHLARKLGCVRQRETHRESGREKREDFKELNHATVAWRCGTMRRLLPRKALRDALCSRLRFRRAA